MILLLVFVVLFLHVVAIALINGIGPMPSNQRARKAIIKLVAQRTETTIYELGCGFGGLAFMLAKRFPERMVIACENSFCVYLAAIVRKSVMAPSLRNLSIVYKSIDKLPLRQGSLGVCYLCPKQMPLVYKLSSQYNLTVISHVFAIRELKEDVVLRVDDLHHSPIYVYERSSIKNNVCHD